MHCSAKLVVVAATFVVAGCASTGGLFSSDTPTALMPYGVQADGPAVIHMVTSPDSPLHNGDTVLSINGKPVTAYSFYSDFTARGSMKVKSADGKVQMIPDSALLSANGKKLKALTFKLGGTMIFPQKVPVYKRIQDAGLISLGKEKGLISASLWHTNPRILEVYVDLRSASTCTSCSLKNIAVMDWSRKDWLTPLSINKVAWIVYPPDGSTGPLMNIPPPTPVSYSSTSNTTGTMNGTFYGNSFSGNYSGSTTSTTTPRYNYAATEMAEAYNLGVILKQARIQKDNKNRRSFVIDRMVNLKIGPMSPGERMTGYVDFVVPNGFGGPFVLAIKGNRKFAAVRFGLAHS